jgi:hypothetical protein
MACYKMHTEEEEPSVDSVDLTVSWDKDNEVLIVTTNGTIPVGAEITLKFSQDDFPIT